MSKTKPATKGKKKVAKAAKTPAKKAKPKAGGETESARLIKATTPVTRLVERREDAAADTEDDLPEMLYGV